MRAEGSLAWAVAALSCGIAIGLALPGGPSGHPVAVPAQLVDSGNAAELVSSLPVPLTAGEADKRVVFSQPVSLATDDIILATAEFQVTNDLGVNTLCVSQLVLGTSPADTTGKEITEANGRNVTPNNHHDQHNKSGTYKALSTDAGRRYVNLVAWAAASRAPSGATLSIDADYGRLSVLQW
jgi:hypothetical protein